MANIANLDIASRLAALPGALGQRLQQAIQLHMNGVKGDASAAQEASRLLELLKRDYPAEPLVNAYLGSALILTARDKTKPIEKMKLSNAGMRLLDAAVAAKPQDGLIRLLRGKNAYQLPERYFQRTRTLIEDYTYLLEQLLRSGAKASAVSFAELVQELGEGFARIGRNQEGAECWRRLESLSQDPALRALLRRKRLEFEGKPAVETIVDDNPFTSLVGATRSIGTALVEWSGQGKRDEKAHKLAQKIAKQEEKKMKKMSKSKQKKLRRKKESNTINIRR